MIICLRSSVILLITDQRVGYEVLPSNQHVRTKSADKSVHRFNPLGTENLSLKNILRRGKFGNINLFLCSDITNFIRSGVLYMIQLGKEIIRGV